MAIGGGIGPRTGGTGQRTPAPAAPNVNVPRQGPIGPRDTTRPGPKPPKPDNIPASTRAILGDFLAQFGLESLMHWAWTRWKELGGGEAASAILQFEVLETPEFKKRYPAYEFLQKQGNAWSVLQIQDYEQRTRELLNTVGLDEEYGHDKLQNLLMNNVSYNELQQRVSMAQQAAQAPNSSLDAMKRLYGVDEKHIAAFFLDPAVMEPKISTMWASGQIGGAARDQGFGDLSVDEAEMLARRGLDRNAADQGFGQLASVKGLTETQISGEGSIDRTTQVGLVAGDAVAQEAFKARQRARTASFQGGSGFGAGQNGVTGFGQTS